MFFTELFFSEKKLKNQNSEKKENPTDENVEQLVIYGPARGRRGAELRVMAAVETKVL